MKILILNAHPDQNSLSDAIAAAYEEGARQGGHDVRLVALRNLDFDLVLHGGFHGLGSLEADITRQHDLIEWCNHLVIVTPNWWWSAPAVLKGYIDRVFVPEFAVRYHARFPYIEPLLTGRSARVIYTQNSPALAGWLSRRDLFWRWISRAVLHHCGFRPVRRRVLFRAKDTSPEQRTRFIDSVRQLGTLGV